MRSRTRLGTVVITAGLCLVASGPVFADNPAPKVGAEPAAVQII
jgi:hypothetical protein